MNQTTDSKPRIILSGMPGKMCLEILALAQSAAWKDRVCVAPFALASPRQAGRSINLNSGTRLDLLTPADLPAALQQHEIPNPLVIDYTAPGCALENIGHYGRAGVPFVMGTTGFDGAEARRLVEAGGITAVIAPNMAVPIVLIRAALANIAEKFPQALNDWTLEIRESHQATKKDVSGTAKAFLPFLEALGARAGDPPIVSLRDPASQQAAGISSEYANGHGWHWYQLTSPDGTVALELSHKVNGRAVYAEGTLVAAEFLAGQVTKGAGGRVFSMEQVLGNRQPGEPNL
jgi:4-hydroxy-tetrahydrodipicolinate reductase